MRFFFFKALYILYFSTKTSNKSLYSMQCWARYFKKVISYITSYFSQIVTELLVTIVTFFLNVQICQITWMSPILNVK